MTKKKSKLVCLDWTQDKRLLKALQGTNQKETQTYLKLEQLIHFKAKRMKQILKINLKILIGIFSNRQNPP